MNKLPIMCAGVALSSDAKLTHIAAPTCIEIIIVRHLLLTNPTIADKAGMHQEGDCQSLKNLTVPHQVKMK